LGVVGAVAPVKQLKLHHCNLLDGQERLAAALALLPELQHLSLVHNDQQGGCMPLPSAALQALQQLTYLELAGDKLQDSGRLQQLQELTRLQDLRLQNLRPCAFKASTFTGLQQLSQLVVQGFLGGSLFETGVIAGKTDLQHLEVSECRIDGGSTGVAELLSHLQDMQQLTYLKLYGVLECRSAHNPPAAAYSALTASSKLQHLDITGCILPEDVWQHMFPVPGRQLPHLQVLNVALVTHPSGPAAAPQTSRLVSCCPGLQSLDIRGMAYSAEQLAPLTGLCSLQELTLHPAHGHKEGLEVVGQMTGLRKLVLRDPYEAHMMALMMAGCCSS
jgi:hypothetical protein